MPQWILDERGDDPYRWRTRDDLPPDYKMNCDELANRLAERMPRAEAELAAFIETTRNMRRDGVPLP